MSSKEHNLAEKYFVDNGLMPKPEDRTERWVLHHKDPLLKTEDPERYAQWNIEDLIPMTHSDHVTWHNVHASEATLALRKLHHSGGVTTHTEESRRKMSESRMGHAVSEETRKKLSASKKGKPKSELHKKHLSESRILSGVAKGENNPNYGKKHPGRHWYNNGEEEILAQECPEGFVPGRL